MEARMTTDAAPLSALLAAALRADRRTLVLRWLERIKDRVAVEPDRVFPTQDLIDHMPLLISGIADYLEDASDEITVQMPVVAKAMELGSLRHAQGFPVRQILWEYEILGGVVFEHLSHIPIPGVSVYTPSDFMRASHRVFRAISVIERLSTLHFLQEAARETHEREQRLRGFNRALSHELKNNLSVILGAASMLKEEFVRTDPAQYARFGELVTRNAGQMSATMANLIELSRLEGESRQQRNVLLHHIAEEVARQLRDFARTHGVEVVLADEWPEVHVPAGIAELCLTNLMSNAIKYHDPAKDQRSVHIRGWVTGSDDDVSGETVIEVRDNGRGIPEWARQHLFERFFRVAEDDSIDGTGLGLSLVRDAVRSVGGRVWLEDSATETTFRIALPARRTEDLAETVDPGAIGHART
jgi:signal transduction histidine kinase